MPVKANPEDLVALFADPDSCPTDSLESRRLADEPAFVAWQQEIPGDYLEMTPEELHRRISRARTLLGEKLVVLGHHYQRDEVIQYADFTGDSFKLARCAAEQDGADYVLFCGVHFMAESADILTEPQVRVILPNLAAGCSMADMAAPADVFAAWDHIVAELGEDHGVIPVTYMNSAASLKAFTGLRGGLVCTSSNAARALEWAQARGKKILFFPDQHLGRNTAYDLGIGLDEMAVWDYRQPGGGLNADDLRAARIILWQGHCSTHQRFTTEQIAKARREHPGVNVIVHPECRWEVVQAADQAGSTEKITQTISSGPAGSSWGIGTEINLVKRLAKEHPDKDIFCLDPVVCPCSTMYRIHPAYLAWTLEGLLRGEVINEVRVDADTRRWALVALNRMLSI
ncbi:MAG: quinolinate synthase NadA [Dehalococcoidia bacterium]